MKIYTGFGDSGETQLLGGQQTRKNDIRVAVCGTLDELNALFGMVASQEIPQQLATQIAQIQAELFTVGAQVAAVGATSKMSLPTITRNEPTRLESEIDKMNDALQPLTNFLLPGGHAAAATMHLARAVCRRAERLMIDLADQFPDFAHEHLFVYLNRLSDWCFVAARFINHASDVDEPIWNPGGTTD